MMTTCRRIASIGFALGLLTCTTSALAQYVAYNGNKAGNFTPAGGGLVLGSYYSSVEVIYWSNQVPFQPDTQTFIPWLLGGNGTIADINPYTLGLEEYSNWTTPITYQSLAPITVFYTDVNNQHLNKNGVLNVNLDDVADIQGELKSLLENPNSGIRPPPTLYMIYLPQGTNVSGGVNGADVSCVNFCGYHYSFTEPNLPNKPLIPYIVIPACASGACPPYDPNQQSEMELATSHEIVEAITDPAPFTGWANGVANGSGEIADECNKEFVYVLPGGNINYHVSTYWSDSQGKCISGSAGQRSSQQILTYDPTVLFGNNGWITVLQSNSDGYVVQQQAYQNQNPPAPPAGAAWTAIVPGHFGSGPGWTDLFFYAAATGREQFYTVNNTSGAMFPLNGGQPIAGPPGVTNIVAGNFTPNSPGVTGLFFYSRNNGDGVGQFYEVVPGSNYYVNAFGGPITDFPMFWDLVASGEFDGQRCGAGGGTDLVFYSKQNAKMGFYTELCQTGAIAPFGRNVVAGPPLPVGLTSTATGYFNGIPGSPWSVMGYNMTTGLASFWANAGGGLFVPMQQFGSQSVGPGWSIVEAAEFGWNDAIALKADQPYADLMFWGPAASGILTTTDGSGDIFQLDTAASNIFQSTIAIPLIGVTTW